MASSTLSSYASANGFEQFGQNLYSVVSKNSVKIFIQLSVKIQQIKMFFSHQQALLLLCQCVQLAHEIKLYNKC